MLIGMSGLISLTVVMLNILIAQPVFSLFRSPYLISFSIIALDIFVAQPIFALFRPSIFLALIVPHGTSSSSKMPLMISLNDPVGLLGYESMSVTREVKWVLPRFYDSPENVRLFSCVRVRL